jgi:hypothetical protein
MVTLAAPSTSDVVVPTSSVRAKIITRTKINESIPKDRKGSAAAPRKKKQGNASEATPKKEKKRGETTTSKKGKKRIATEAKPSTPSKKRKKQVQAKK